MSDIPNFQETPEQRTLRGKNSAIGMVMVICSIFMLILAYNRSSTTALGYCGIGVFFFTGLAMLFDVKGYWAALLSLIVGGCFAVAFYILALEEEDVLVKLLFYFASAEIAIGMLFVAFGQFNDGVAQSQAKKAVIENKPTVENNQSDKQNHLHATDER